MGRSWTPINQAIAKPVDILGFRDGLTMNGQQERLTKPITRCEDVCFSELNNFAKSPGAMEIGTGTSRA